MKTRTLDYFRKRLIQWYDKNHRRLPWRETIDPYHIWVSEVMLQQTQVNTVIPYYRRFLDHFPELKQLARADLQEVLKVWEGMGYYARARNMHQAAVSVLNEHNGLIPVNLDKFKRLPGVGDYIASAVLSIAFSQPYAVVDGNVKRVIARMQKIDAPVNDTKSFSTFKRASHTLLDRRRPGIYNQAIMELGATVCKPKNPECGICPIQSYCLSCRDQRVPEYPRRVRTRTIPQYHVVVGIVFKNGKVLITRRKINGLLGGLWEFPGGNVIDEEACEEACIREIREKVNLSIEINTYLQRIRHAYTHFKIIMDVFICRYVSGEVFLNGPTDYHWVTLDEIDRYPFPRSHHKFIPLLKGAVNSLNTQSESCSHVSKSFWL
jgi:A/G-specific adenine glycosylase